MVLRVSGDDVRHLKPDERTLGSILRHFLYAGECSENKKSGAHALLLASNGATATGVWLAPYRHAYMSLLKTRVLRGSRRQRNLPRCSTGACARVCSTL